MGMLMVLLLIAPIKEKGHNVYVLAANVNAPIDDFVYDIEYTPTFMEKLKCAFLDRIFAGYRQYYLGARSIMSGIKKIEKHCSIDVLEIEESFGWHYYLQKKSCFPVVMRLHGPHFVNGVMGNKELTKADYNRFKREEKAFRSAQYVNAPCEWVLSSVKDKYNLTWPLSSVFYNPIELSEEKDRWSATSYVPYQILFVGRFDSHKGGDLVIKAFAEVLKKFPDATLIFVGPDRGVEVSKDKTISITDAIDEYVPKGKVNNIDYLGLVDKNKIKKLRKESHITVMASRNENFPYTVLEPLSSASPVIAPSVGGISEVFEDGVSGIYFKGSDVNDFSKKIVDLLSNKEKLEALSKNAYVRCVDNFSPSKVSADAVKFYEKAVDLFSRNA